MANLHGSKNDEYLTPPDLVKALGPFSLDPCAAVGQEDVWRTAKVMLTQKTDGLSVPWSRYGRVFLNPPYSNAKPFIERFVEHRRGIALVSAKSTDSQWAQLLLNECHSAMWLAGRILFWRLGRVKGQWDAYETEGKWLSNLIVAASEDDTDILSQLAWRTDDRYSGAHFKRLP